METYNNTYFKGWLQLNYYTGAGSLLRNFLNLLSFYFLKGIFMMWTIFFVINTKIYDSKYNGSRFFIWYN